MKIIGSPDDRDERDYAMKRTVLAPAKLNLFLDITGRRSDGYHLVNMVMQAVSLYDEVTVSREDTAEGIRIECSDNEIPCDETNTAYRAAEIFMNEMNQPAAGISIRIKKRIPSQAGLAGGSTDAAAVLYALSELTDAGCSRAELAAMAERIGADVPFCVYGGTMTAGGIGTILNPLPDMPDCYIVIVKPSLKVSTPEAYRLSDVSGYEHLASADKVISGICGGSVGDIAGGLYNKFEAVLHMPEIDAVKLSLCQEGALGACMTGSGSAVFGLFEDKSSAAACADRISSHFPEVFLVQPVSHGVVLR